MIVVDASVAVKWFLYELGTEAAQSLLVSHDALYAPELIEQEFLEALLRQHRVNTFLRKETEELCSDWQNHLANEALILLKNAELYEQAIEFALDYKHPLADCSYIAVSQLTGSPLITADKTFYKRCHGKHDMQLLEL